MMEVMQDCLQILMQTDGKTFFQAIPVGNDTWVPVQGSKYTPFLTELGRSVSSI